MRTGLGLAHPDFSVRSSGGLEPAGPGSTGANTCGVWGPLPACAVFIIKQRRGLIPQVLSSEKGVALEVEDPWLPLVYKEEEGWVFS